MTPHPYTPIYSIALGLIIADLVVVYAIHRSTHHFGLEIVLDVFITLICLALFLGIAGLMRKM